MAKFKKLIYNTTEITNINRVIFNGVVYDRCNYVDVDINVNATTSTTYETTMLYYLTSSNANYVTISSVGKSFIINGTTYTPSLSSSRYDDGYGVRYYEFPEGSDVGTDGPGSSAIDDGDYISDFTSQRVNYFTAKVTIESRTKSIAINSTTGVVSGDTSECTYTTKKVAEEFKFDTITWNDNITSGRAYTLSSGQGTTSAKYERQKTSYNPDLYISFSFKASTGAITWNTSGGTYTSTLVNNVKNNFSIDVQPRYYYTHNSTSWNFTGSELVEVVRASKEKLTLRFYV